ncbi:uncharacterized protein LOC125503462, partial [Dendroctonus ponderosae]|uniref:uncharacterized protein LOC125503462 n=1 Tax=Dendroctonus ponderosae TaxID=77166 RepID=UPI002035E85A
MSFYHSENATDNIPTIKNIEDYDERCVAEMGSQRVEKNEAEFHLANESIVVSPRSTHSGASSSEVFTSPMAKPNCTRLRPKSVRTSNVRSSIIRPSPSSSIPLPVKSSGPIKVQPLLKNAKAASRTISMIGRPTSFANKHTLEIQFINKNKRFAQMRRDLLEKQKPIMDLYHNLTQLKSRLEELGRSVKLEDVKLVYFEDCNKKFNYDVT